MKRQEFAIVALAAMFGLASPGPSWAQGRGGTPVGTAEPRGGGGGGESSSGGSAAPRSGGGDGGSSSGSSSGGASSSSTPSAPSMNPSYTPPSPSAERVSYAPQRRGGGGSGGGSNGGGQAVPRGSTGGGEEARAGARAPSSSTSASAGANDNNGDRRAVPTYSRPRGDHPVTGEAVPRPPGSYGSGNTYIVPYYPYGYYPYGYYPYYGGYWGSGYGYGLGYMYDPFWSPFGYGGSGYGGSYGYGSPYDSGYYVGGSSGGYDRTTRDTGSLRLKIKPREAQVYVDGYLVGDIDSFDGAFQKLGIESGGHRVELKADGYEPLQFDVLITPGETVTYKGEMKPIK